MRRSAFVVALFAAVAIAGCTVPAPSPTVPPPTLPAGVGVSWLRDVGGTYGRFKWRAPGQSFYTPSYDRYVTTAGGTTGPTTASSPPFPLGFPTPIESSVLDSVHRLLLSQWWSTVPTALPGSRGTAMPARASRMSETINDLDLAVDQLTFPAGTCEFGIAGSTVRASPRSCRPRMGPRRPFS